jgi:ABC-type molybdate transport system ATPase subunit
MVDASLFAALGSSTMGDISLVRVIASNLSAANATISLRGYFTLDVPAIYEATGDATDAGDGG